MLGRQNTSDSASRVGRPTLRSLNAATICATGSPPAWPRLSAAMPACCAMADAPDVLWLWIAAAPLAYGRGAAR